MILFQKPMLSLSHLILFETCAPDFGAPNTVPRPLEAVCFKEVLITVFLCAQKVVP